MRKKPQRKELYAKGQFLKFSRTSYLPTGKGRRIVRIPRPFFFASTAFVSTDAVIHLSICFATLSSIYLPCGKFDITALAVGFDMISIPRLRSKHIEP
ncbi:MAG: hypothetical protein IKB75_01955, partial [Clostridia bacterium]|nr:hypothetical protein [Clostridia bacterium]